MLKMKSAYLFFDWYMTINELVLDEKINKNYFHQFFIALKNLQKELNYKLNLIILSGTSQNSAMKIYSLLDNTFKKEQSTFFKGLAYEYGGFFIDKNGAIKQYYNKTTTLDNINKICKKYNIYRCKDYKLYYNFKFKQISKKVLNFVDYCKNAYQNKDFEFYNDKYGKGLDIKNKDLNKYTFVTKYLKNKKADMLIFGGDSVQDEIMFEKSSFQNKYFLGFKNLNNNRPSYILSSKKNILGIIEDINALTLHLKNVKTL